MNDLAKRHASYTHTQRRGPPHSIWTAAEQSSRPASKCLGAYDHRRTARCKYRKPIWHLTSPPRSSIRLRGLMLWEAFHCTASWEARCVGSALKDQASLLQSSDADVLLESFLRLQNSRQQRMKTLRSVKLKAAVNANSRPHVCGPDIVANQRPPTDSPHPSRITILTCAYTRNMQIRHAEGCQLSRASRIDRMYESLATSL